MWFLVTQGACGDDPQVAPECDEGEVRALDCGPDTEQAAPPACVSGLWENAGVCVCPEGLVYDELAQSCAREVAGCDPDGALFGGGDGTAEEPFLICSVAQLHAVRARDGEESHYVLAATLDLSDEEGFEPLGALHGSFDGAGHGLVGLTLEASPAAGLFAAIGEVGDDEPAHGEVRDLVLRGVNVQGGTLAGALAPVVGTSSDNVVERVRLYASEVMTAQASGATGGLVGRLMAGTVRASVVDAAVSGHDEAGGLVGETYLPIEQSFARGSVSAQDLAGGLVGSLLRAAVVASWCDGAVSGSGGASGLVGAAVADTTIRHSWTASSVSVGSGGVARLLIRTGNEAVVIDGVVARAQGSIPLVLASPMPDLSGALAVTDDELALPSTFTALGWDFEEVWVMSAEGGFTAPDLRDNPRGE